MKAATDKRQSLTRSVISLGLPILVGEIGHIATGFADNIMVGRYATEALASASMVNNVFNIPYLAFIGFAFGITPLVGMRFAQSNKSAIGSLLRNGIIVNILFAMIVSGIMLAIYFNLHRLGQPDELLPLIRPYFIINILGIIPVALFSVYSQWSYGLKQTSTPMWITLISNVINVAGNYILIFGKFGAPEMGLTGAGISTLFARVVCPLAAYAVLHETCLEELEYQPQQAAVLYVPCKPCHESSVVHLVEELFEVEVHHCRVPLPHIRTSLFQGLVRAPIRAKAETRFREHPLVQRAEDLRHGLLHDPVFHRGYSQLPRPAVRLRDLHPSDRDGPVLFRKQLPLHFEDVRQGLLLELLDGLPVDSARALVGPDAPPRRMEVVGVRHFPHEVSRVSEFVFPLHGLLRILPLHTSAFHLAAIARQVTGPVKRQRHLTFRVLCLPLPAHVVSLSRDFVTDSALRCQGQLLWLLLTSAPPVLRHR